MRDINAELSSVSLVRCPECGIRIPNHQVLIQRHFMQVHKIDNQLKKREADWRFHNARPLNDPLHNVFA